MIKNIFFLVCGLAVLYISRTKWKFLDKIDLYGLPYRYSFFVLGILFSLGAITKILFSIF